MAGAVLVPTAFGADCVECFDSTRTCIYGYGYACAGSGGTCTDCTNDSGGSCVADGSASCEPTEENKV